MRVTNSRCIFLMLQPSSTKRLRQPIEQFRMAGRLAELAEIAGRRHQAPAEMILPDAIDDDARRQRMIRARQPIGQRRAPARRCPGRPAA